MLASASRDRTVRLWNPWNPSSRDRPLQLDDFRAYVQTLAFSPDGLLLATGDWAGDILIWDARTGIRIAQVAKGPASAEAEPVLADPQLGSPIWCVAFSSDGQYFAAGRKGIQVWRIHCDRGGTGEDPQISVEPVARPTEELISGTCFSQDSKLLAWSNSLPSWVPSVWDLQNNRLLCSLPTQVATGTYAIAFHPDNNLLTFVSANRAIEAWNVTTGKQVSEFGRSDTPSSSTQNTVALTHDGRLFAWALGSKVTIWDTQQKRPLLALPPERGVVWCLAWSPDGQFLAAGTSAGGPMIWSIPKIRHELAKLGLDW
jgi:WD40 repeat protein